MIDSRRLLDDLTKLLKTLEDDLRRQVHDRADVRATLQADYDAARQVGRTQDTFETWSEEPLTQAAVAWILGTVYVRFLEDNQLVDPMLSGTGDRRTRALQDHQHYFEQHPTDSERQFLEHLFGRLAEIPATAALFDRRHNPLWRLPLSADAARGLVEFWQRIDPETGQVAHDFEDEALDTRFLGDLYQDLSEPVRKRYALLQTPRFVEAFILDRTLTPAIETFGYREVRLIDPTCGSGHFLLGAFDRLLALAQEHEPGKDARVHVQDILSRVVGVDINPYAVAIARFRLMVAALKACDIARLADAPGFDVSVVAADSLLHGPRFADQEMGAVQRTMLEGQEIEHYYFAEDETKVRALLGRQYHAVVGNPPYITVNDAALNVLYRQRYGSCHRQYSLVVPFFERFFELAIQPEGEDVTRAGFVGMIVAKSFTKREFGKKLIQQFLPRWDLTCVVDTEAHIPGHGTPTVIIYGRHRRPQTDVVRAVMGIRGEPTTPEDPAKGLVWMAVLHQIDRTGSESPYVSVTDLSRASLHTHPWSIGGGGAAELKELLDDRATTTLAKLDVDIGFLVITGEDNCLLVPRDVLQRQKIALHIPCVDGESIRDYVAVSPFECIWPYTSTGDPLPSERLGPLLEFLWPYRTTLKGRKVFGAPIESRGLPWWAIREVYASRLKTPLSIAFAFVATHNHFVLDRGGKVFNRSAPVIKLKEGTTEDDHLALLGLLNSSTACFWMKQVSHSKGSQGINEGLKSEAWEQFWEFTATGLSEYPIVPVPARTTSQLETLGRALATPEAETHDRAAVEALWHTAVSAQEELDWQVYHAYGLTEQSLEFSLGPPKLRPGERAFEIVMARRMAAGELETTWFERHGSKPITELPSDWPPEYRQIVERRIALIESDRNIGLIEQPEYKRRWNIEPFEAQLRRHQRQWLADRLESPEFWPAISVTSVSKLADRVRQNSEFMQVAEGYAGNKDFDVAELVSELVTEEAVPFLPVLRYKDSGLAKRAQWERTWNLQRREDTGEKAGEIPVPPKYKSADFRSGVYWRHRGKLDVPKERFISYPGCERAADGSLPIAWAGWDHAQQARALGAYYMQIKTEEGTVPDKLVPLLAGLLELIPWIRQWHSSPDPEFGLELGPYFADFVENEARALGFTVDEVRAWRPEPVARSGRRGRPRGRLGNQVADQ